jgi:HopA1 effector protein family
MLPNLRKNYEEVMFYPDVTGFMGILSQTVSPTVGSLLEHVPNKLDETLISTLGIAGDQAGSPGPSNNSGVGRPGSGSDAVLQAPNARASSNLLLADTLISTIRAVFSENEPIDVSRPKKQINDQPLREVIFGVGWLMKVFGSATDIRTVENRVITVYKRDLDRKVLNTLKKSLPQTDIKQVRTLRKRATEGGIVNSGKFIDNLNIHDRLLDGAAGAKLEDYPVIGELWNARENIVGAESNPRKDRIVRDHIRRALYGEHKAGEQNYSENWSLDTGYMDRLVEYQSTLLQIGNERTDGKAIRPQNIIGSMNVINQKFIAKESPLPDEEKIKEARENFEEVLEFLGKLEGPNGQTWTKDQLKKMFEEFIELLNPDHPLSTEENATLERILKPSDGGSIEIYKILGSGIGQALTKKGASEDLQTKARNVYNLVDEMTDLFQVGRTFFWFDRSRTSAKHRIYIQPTLNHHCSVLKDLVQDVIDNPEKYPGVQGCKSGGLRGIESRQDRIVLYVSDELDKNGNVVQSSKENRNRVLSYLQDYQSKNPDAFEKEPSRICRQIVPGVAIAVGESSYTDNMAKIIANALTNATTRDEYMNLIKEGMRKQNYNPDRMGL